MALGFTMASTSISWDSPIGWSVVLVAALGALLWPAGRTWLWVVFVLIAAGPCNSSYLKRSSRVHCRITGLVVLLCAVDPTSVQLAFVPFLGKV